MAELVPQSGWRWHETVPNPHGQGTLIEHRSEPHKDRLRELGLTFELVPGAPKESPYA